MSGARKPRDQAYGFLLRIAGCGPFDGGCLAVAKALRSRIGGELVVLVREDGAADHAALYLGGMLIDFDGPLRAGDFVRKFNAEEKTNLAPPCVGFRPFADGDLPEAFVASGEDEATLADLLLRAGITWPLMADERTFA